MGFYLANYLKHQGWGPERITAGEINRHQYITGISLFRGWGRNEVAHKDYLLILTKAFFRAPDWMQNVSLLQGDGVVAIAYIEGRNTTETIEQLIQICRQLNFSLLALPESTFVHDLLIQSEQLFSVDEQGQSITINEMLNLLRESINTQKLSGLLQVLHTWLDCQAILAIKHDIHAYPPLPDFGEIYVHHNHGERLPRSTLFPWIDVFYIGVQQTYDMRCQIHYDGKPLGVLSLRRQERPFDDKELKAADYAAVLCAGLNYTFVKSQRIQDLLSAACQGDSYNSEDVGLLPESGYALALRERVHPETRDLNLEEMNDFLGYLIHTTFGIGTYYAFLDNNYLVLFCSTSDIRPYVQQLLALLRKNKRVFLAGVSQCYPRKKIDIAFAEASHAVNIGQYLDEKQEVFFFHDMGIYRFFNYPDNCWSVNQMLNEMSEKMDIAFDEEKKQVLIDTLICLVKNNFNYAKTSEEMFTHPNTIRYRIRLLEQVWDKDLSKDEDRLLLSIIGKLLPLWQRYSSRC